MLPFLRSLQTCLSLDTLDAASRRHKGKNSYTEAYCQLNVLSESWPWTTEKRCAKESWLCYTPIGPSLHATIIACVRHVPSGAHLQMNEVLKSFPHLHWLYSFVAAWGISISCHKCKAFDVTRLLQTRPWTQQDIRTLTWCFQEPCPGETCSSETCLLQEGCDMPKLGVHATPSTDAKLSKTMSTPQLLAAKAAKA